MGIIRFIQAHNRNKQLKGMRQLKEQELDILENRELRDIRTDTIKHRTYNSTVEDKCQMCGRLKGYSQFYLVTYENKSLNVCERCADEIDRKDRTKIHYKLYDSLDGHRCQICGKTSDNQYLRTTNGEMNIYACETCSPNAFSIVKKCDEGGLNTSLPITEKIDDEALQIIRLRYAKGEITKEQFEQMKNDLEK